MISRYDGKLSELVSRYDLLERERGWNPEDIRGWMNRILRPEVQHKFLLVGPKESNTLSEQHVVFVLGKGEQPPVEAPYSGVKYATVEIETKQSIIIPEGRDRVAPLVNHYRIVLKTTEGKSYALREISMRDVTDCVVEHHLRESDLYEKEKQGYTQKSRENLSQGAEMLRTRKKMSEDILCYTRERERDMIKALAHAVKRINIYTTTRDISKQHIEELRRNARKRYIAGITGSEGWSDKSYMAFAAEHRTKIRDIDLIEDELGERTAKAYNEVKSAVMDLKLALMSDPIIVEAYGIAHMLTFRNGRHEGNTTIVPGDDETVMEIVSDDRKVSPIPLAAIDSLAIYIWKSLTNETTYPGRASRAHPKITVLYPTKISQTADTLPDLDALIKGIPVDSEAVGELVGAGKESCGF